MELIQLTGYLAGFIIAISLIPQVIQAWKTKSTKDISLPWTYYIITRSLVIFYIWDWHKGNANYSNEHD